MVQILVPTLELAFLTMMMTVLLVEKRLIVVEFAGVDRRVWAVVLAVEDNFQDSDNRFVVVLSFCNF